MTHRSLQDGMAWTSVWDFHHHPMGLGWRPYGLSLLYEVHVHLQSSGGPTQTAGVHTLIWCSSYISNTNIPFLSCHSRTPSWDFIPKEILMSAPSWVIPWTIHLLQGPLRPRPRTAHGHAGTGETRPDTAERNENPGTLLFSSSFC